MCIRRTIVEAEVRLSVIRKIKEMGIKINKIPLFLGATIVGKSVCENLCFSGGSSTAAKGPVKNPHDPTRATAGSSSGSAVVVSAYYLFIHLFIYSFIYSYFFFFVINLIYSLIHSYIYIFLAF